MLWKLDFGNRLGLWTAPWFAEEAATFGLLSSAGIFVCGKSIRRFQAMILSQIAESRRIKLLLTASTSIALCGLCYLTVLWSNSNSEYELTIEFPRSGGVMPGNAVVFDGNPVGCVAEVASTLDGTVIIRVKIDMEIQIGHCYVPTIVERRGVKSNAEQIVFAFDSDVQSDLFEDDGVMNCTVPYVDGEYISYGRVAPMGN